LTAAAELVEEKSGNRSTAYVTNLSLYGCTLGATRPPRQGASIHIEIVTGDESFQSRATVAHSRGYSSGLIFQDLQPQSLIVLRRLLARAMKAIQRREEPEEWS
jgi:PilZ domain